MFIPPGEQIAQTKKCLLSGSEFIITDKDLEFYEKISPVFNGQKYGIPTPKLCPEERMRRRMMFRNFRHLYPSKSSLSGTSIISMYNENAPFPVYHQSEWWGDMWSGNEYALSVDFTKTFEENISILHNTVPRSCLNSKNSVNSDYANPAVNSKNCYLVFGCVNNEDCRYGHIVWRSRNCQDCLYIYECEECSNCIDCVKCHGVHNSIRSKDCSHSSYLTDCDGCTDCFACVGLKNKQYHIFNQKLDKEVYFQRMHELNFGSKEQMNRVKKQIDFNYSQGIFRSYEGFGNENVIGNYAYFSRNCFACYDIKKCENIRYSATLEGFTDSYDCNYSGSGNELAYETIHASGRHTLFCHNALENSDIYYCDHVYNSENCFGCVGLKNQQHCFLNKSYSKSEYESLCSRMVDHMISTGEWGEFFPASLSPFGYNETIAQEYFPLTKEQTQVQGWKWYDGENKNTYIGSHYTPHTIENYDEKIVGYEVAQKNIDELLAGIIECEVTKKPFKIIKQELVFYIENKLPIPTKHPDQRHKERMSLRNPRELHERICPECQKQMITTYRPNRPEKVVCEECYRKLVY